MPTITVDDDFSSSLLAQIRDNYLQREPRTGAWHVSDLLFPRYAVLGRKFPRPPDKESIGFFFTGEAYHEFIQKLLGVHNSEVRGELCGVLGTADFFDGDVLLEIKTSRKWTIPEEPQDNYVEQASYYAAMFKKPTVRIVVIYPTAGRKWDGSASSTLEIKTWKLDFSENELNAKVVECYAMTKHLTDVMEGKAPLDSLAPCPSWKYGAVERDSEKKEYFINIRCTFAKEGLCDCGEELRVECQRKNDNRRIKPLSGRYK